jgi:hypothetical protein
MKTSACPSIRTGHRRRGGEEGMAVIVVIALLVIILIYIAAGVRTLNNLGRDVRLIEKQQTQRLQPALGTTNTMTTTSNVQSLGLPAR